MNPFVTKGAFSWFELMTSDVESAKKFYGEIFGWNFEDEISENMTYTLIKIGENKIAGMYDKKYALVENSEKIPSHWGNYITVDDIKQTVSKVKELGGNIIVDITPIPTIGEFAVIQDLQGAVISLMQYSLNEDLS